MRNIPGNLLKQIRCEPAFRMAAVWMVFFLLIGGIIAPQFLIQGKAAPVIFDGDSAGSWEDNFEDLTGVDVIDNIALIGNNIEIVDTTIFFDDFTGTNGDPPDPAKWDIIDDGYTLEINNNQLQAYSSPDTSTWYTELIQSNKSISVNHILTWRQNLYSTSDGMYYHFFILNGSDDSRLLGVNQNSADEYQVLNFINMFNTQIDSFVSGWHDYQVTFNNGSIAFYYDGGFEYEFDYGVSSVKYQFGNHQVSQPGSIYTDDIYINSTLSGNLTSTEIILPSGKTWETLFLNKTEPAGTNIKVTVVDGATFLLISGYENLIGPEIDISGIDHLSHPTIRLRGQLEGNGAESPLLHSWNVTWFDTIPPATPSGFAVNNPFTGFSLIISWDPNLETDMNNYVLYYSTDNVTFNKLTNLSSDSVFYIHYGRVINQTYYYKVAAADEIPNESPPTLVGEGTPDLDYDGDGVGNLVDLDDDNDGILDILDAYPFNPINDMETKIDNIQTIVENLNITELTEAIDYLNTTLPQQVDQLDDLLSNITNLNITNLMDYLKGMNASLYAEIQNLLSQITSDITDMMASLVLLEGNLSTQHDSLNATIIMLDTLISNEHALTRSEILDALNNSVTLLQNLDNNMTSHDLDINNILSLIDALIQNENNLTRNQLIDNVTDILNQLDVVDQNILNEIGTLNLSVSDQLTDLLNNMTTDQDALRTWLEIVIPTLDANITAANNTLHKQLDDLDTLMTSFYNDLDTDLTVIISDIQALDTSTGQDHSDIIDILNGLPDEIGNLDLSELKAMLTDLAQNISLHDQAMADDILGVVSDIESFEAVSQQKLNDINITLDDLAQLQNILAELDALENSLSEAEAQLQESIDEIPTEKAEKEEEIGLVEILLLVIMIMLIINILVSIMGGKKRRSDEPPIPPTYGYSQEPYPPSQPQAPIEDATPPIENEHITQDEREELPQVPPPPPEY